MNWHIHVGMRMFVRAPDDEQPSVGRAIKSGAYYHMDTGWFAEGVAGDHMPLWVSNEWARVVRVQEVKP